MCHSIHTPSHSLSLRVAVLSVAMIAMVSASDAIRIDEMIVIPIDSVEVPASRSGRLSNIEVKEGHEVQRGQVMGTLDQRHARLAVELAEIELAIAKQVSVSESKVHSAQGHLASEKHTARRLAITEDIAKLKANNRLRVLAAQKSQAAAENEFKRAASSRQQYIESVSKSELESLKLAVEKSRLESKQAHFERDVAQRQVQAEMESAKQQQGLIQKAQAEVEAAGMQRSIAKQQLQNRETQREIAIAILEDHRLLAPMAGRITKVFKNVGAWAREGESVVRIVRLDRLRLEGFASMGDLKRFTLTKTIDLEIQTGGQPIHRPGEIVFIDPEIDPVNGEFRFWIDFENPDQDVLPGMRASARLTP